MRPWMFALLLSLSLSRAAASVPTQAEWETARQAVSRQTGLELHWGQGLWLNALRMRSPLVAVWRHGRCEIGLTGWLPGAAAAAWFDGTPDAARALWLEGMLHHEAAHCSRQSGAGKAQALTGLSVARREEAAADLAFAMHLLSDAEHGPGLLARLMALRLPARGGDAVHDTFAVLSCFALADRLGLPGGVDDWLVRCPADPEPRR